MPSIFIKSNGQTSIEPTPTKEQVKKYTKQPTPTKEEVEQYTKQPTPTKEEEERTFIRSLVDVNKSITAFLSSAIEKL